MSTSSVMFRRLIAGAMFALFLFFALVVIVYPDNFFVDDSYFYSQTAWNIAHGAGSTFNRIIPTNGYHPLWMALLAAMFSVVPAKTQAIHAVGVLLSVLDATTLLLLCALLKRTASNLFWPAFALLVPFCFCTQLGTEGAVSAALLASLMFSAYLLVEAPTYKQGVVYTLLGSLAVLARLDNIFIIASLWISVCIYSVHLRRPAILRVTIPAIPIYVLFWGLYLWSNLHWFGTLQPISGMLKAHPIGEVRDFHRVTPLALLALCVIGLTLPIVAKYRRDRLFFTVELPFAIGVLLHAAYIYLVLSHETHWSWYYTSWMLLAALLLSRSLSVLLAYMPERLNEALAGLALMMLSMVWFRSSYLRRGHIHPANIGAGLQENLHDRLHVQRVLAFDLAGRMAFYSDVQVVTLDGLMGDLQFQHDLQRIGVGGVVAMHGLQAFVGPPQPMDAFDKGRFCDHIFLSSMQFHCVAAGPDAWNVDRVDVFARLTGGSAGSLSLPQENLLWSDPDVNQIAVWRLPAGEITAVPR